MNASNLFREKTMNKNEQNEFTGNRKTMNDILIPPDNAGNLFEMEAAKNLSADGLGNSIEGEPTHLKSGILSSLVENNHEKRARIRSHVGKKIFSTNPIKKERYKADDYIQKLQKDFLSLLSQKKGEPFSFFVKAKNFISDINDESNNKKLSSLKNIILSILKQSVITAEVELAKFKGNNDFIVYFIDIKSKDHTMSKYIILALRKVVGDYIQKHVDSNLNIFLVLINAKEVMEEHLLKIGAKRV